MGVAKELFPGLKKSRSSVVPMVQQPFCQRIMIQKAWLGVNPEASSFVSGNPTKK
jgi:hypothetical protein